jgi:hypothetical protein
MRRVLSNYDQSTCHEGVQLPGCEVIHPIDSRHTTALPYRVGYESVCHLYSSVLIRTLGIFILLYAVSYETEVLSFHHVRARVCVCVCVFTSKLSRNWSILLHLI